MDRQRPFDAVLIMAFGGPEGPADVRPFMENVVRGKSVRRERIEQVVKGYELFGGVSPLPAVTRRQARGLGQRLRAGGVDVPIYVGMRYWHPFVADTLAEMAQAGVGRAIGFIAAAHHSHASCSQYKETVRDARRSLREQGRPDVEITYVDSWYEHPDFIRAHADHIREALGDLPAALRDRARIVFTAHSIPQAMADACCYRQQLRASCLRVIEHLGLHNWALVYQSRSGRAQDEWLEPDVCDYLKAEHARGLQAAVLAPIGFVIDHIEVLYDLDRRALGLCQELGLPAVRASTLNDDPIFLDMMTDLVRQTWEHYCRSIPLPIIARGPGKSQRP